ncbi:hypothetical protein DPQ33_05810 [Oceanidesulfovibrio indonesiensis]|uniref:Tetratricopeptide repeat protein n=1 Tax=Oceanidesulfovibrio indonesiensis TaxID=54767 RepID=A0A7M3MG86_9BACT|nr:tetratricopeptide repeat protein [Oceanidesulfovibrio indonesiensis]TVM18269.1 hypothetical protein DPQ33_05810 [Oceanidesulfovibrio indonesiensis]
MTDEGRTRKLTRRELFTSLRPQGLKQQADRWRSGLADSLDKYVPDNDSEAGKSFAGKTASHTTRYSDAPEMLPGRTLEAISLGQPDEAVAALRPYVKHKPKDREARLLLGRILYKDGAIVQSRVEFERILRESHEDSLCRWPASCAALCLACALARCGKLEKASGMLLKAMDEDRPQATATLERLAEALGTLARQDPAEDASLDTAVDGLVATLENYIEAAYPTPMEMAADLAAGETPTNPGSTRATAT